MDSFKKALLSPPQTELLLEDKKNRFLACLYKNDIPGAREIFLSVEKIVTSLTVKDFSLPTGIPASSLPRLSENSEKLLNQICRIYKTFESKIPAQFSDNMGSAFQNLRQLLIKCARRTDNRILPYISFQQWEASLNLKPFQKDLLYKTAMTFQLSSGCSNFCRRCNEWALPKVRAHFSFAAIKAILNRMTAQGNTHISLYGASDPLDWQEKNRSVVDVVRLADQSGLDYSLLTKVPKQKTARLKQLIRGGANISVSQTTRNRHRIRIIEQDLQQRISKQHDTDDLLIPACLDEDFTTVKPSITDGYGAEITPDGAYIIIPTFTSALHPFGHKKIPVTRETRFFPAKRTGRHALLVDYFKPLKGYDCQKKESYPDRLLDVQIESILLDNGSDALTPPGMRSVKEYFSIFDLKARHQRKKMTLSIFRKLKKRTLKGNPLTSLPLSQRKLYRAKLEAHMALCKKSNCLKAKKNTAAFFLSAVADYKTRHRERTRVIRFLLQDEIRSRKTVFFMWHNDISELFLDDKTNAFDLFRHLALQVISSADITDQVRTFIKNNPSRYDPVTDLFVGND